MKPYAGYTVVLGIKQEIMQDMVRLLYLAGKFPHSFRASESMSSIFEFSVDFFNDTPEFILLSEQSDSLFIKFTAWGPMTVSLPKLVDGQIILQSETYDVLFESEILVPHDVNIEDSSLIFGVDGNNAKLISKSFTVLNGPPFSPPVQSLLGNSLFNNLLEQAIKENLVSLTDELPAIDISFLDPILGPILDNVDSEDNDVELYTTAKSFNNALIVGIDYEFHGFGTAGDPNLLTDITNDMDMSLWINPLVWAPKLREQLLEGTVDREGVRASVENSGAVLNYFSVSLLEGCIHIAGKATMDPYGSVDFSFDLYPKLIRPAQVIDYGYDEDGEHVVRHIQAREELWFAIQNIVVDVDRADWVVAVEVLAGVVVGGVVGLVGGPVAGGLAGVAAGIITAAVIESFINLARFNVYAGIAVSDRTDGNNRTYEFRISNDAPPIKAHLESFDIHEYGVFLALSCSTSFPPAKIIGLTYLDSIERLRNNALRYRVQLPNTVHPEDPKLKIRWTVRNMNNNTIIHNSDGAAQENTEISFSEIDNALTLLLSCRVYRALGDTILDFYNIQIEIGFPDRLDRSHPFVRWYHYVYTPDVLVEADGSQSILGGHIKYRTSRIHRTDFPGRCIMVARYQISKPHRFRIGLNPKPRIEYMDRLPFPVSELNAHRRELCEYCFFGSPVNLVPLPLPSID